MKLAVVLLIGLIGYMLLSNGGRKSYNGKKNNKPAMSSSGDPNRKPGGGARWPKDTDPEPAPDDRLPDDSFPRPTFGHETSYPESAVESKPEERWDPRRPVYSTGPELPASEHGIPAWTQDKNHPWSPRPRPIQIPRHEAFEYAGSPTESEHAWSPTESEGDSESDGENSPWTPNAEHEFPNWTPDKIQWPPIRNPRQHIEDNASDDSESSIESEDEYLQWTPDANNRIPIKRPTRPINGGFEPPTPIIPGHEDSRWPNPRDSPFNPPDHEVRPDRIRNPSQGTVKELSEEERSLVTNGHNSYRRKAEATSMNQLEWIPKLAELAGTENKDECQNELQATRSYDAALGYVKISQSSYIGSGDTIVKKALDELRVGADDYTEEFGTCPWRNADCDRYKQMMWENAVGLGCAKLECPFEGAFESFNVRLFCVYGLLKTKHVLKKPYTKATTKTPVGSQCKENYKKNVVDGLCYGELTASQEATMPEADKIDSKHEEQVIFEPNPDPNAPVPLSKEEEIEIENTFNNIRVEAHAYKMNKLVWNETIATALNEYWGKCAQTLTPPKHAEQKQFAIIEYGNKIGDSENIRMVAYFETKLRPHIRTVLSYMNPKGGKEVYRSTTGNCGELNGDEAVQKCRQYKQIVTAKSHRVGCAMVKCEIGRFSKTTSFRMICAFMPPFPIKRAYIPADAERPAGSGCKEAENGLCIGDQLVGDEDEQKEPQPVDEFVPKQDNNGDSQYQDGGWFIRGVLTLEGHIMQISHSPSVYVERCSLSKYMVSTLAKKDAVLLVGGKMINRRNWNQVQISHIPITGDEQKEILHALNEIRAGVPALKMNELMWERSLDVGADAYGGKCPKITAPSGADDKRFVIVDPIVADGKTIGRWMTVYFEGNDRPTVQSALSHMISKAGKDLYDSLRSGNCGFLEDDKTKRECEKYKIIVSARTNRIGCAMVPCTNWGLGSTKSFRLVCQFVPTFYENRPAFTPAEVPGSGCTKKSNNWPGLCVDEPEYEDEQSELEKAEPEAHPLDGEEEAQLLKKFNDARVEARAFAMNKLNWDPDLATHAVDVGKRCQAPKESNPAQPRHFVVVEHKKTRARLTFYIMGAERPDVDAAFSYLNLHHGKRIYDNIFKDIQAKRDCDIMKEKHQQEECLQYKQIVSAKTNRIGCALVKCPQPVMLGGAFSSQDTRPSFRLVCDFKPPYEDGIAYTPAGDREPGSGCKQAEGGLCVGEDENTQPKGDSGVILLNDDEKQEVLKILNDARKDARATAMNKLEWNWILEKRAKRLGGKCEKQEPPVYLPRTAKEFVIMEVHGGRKHVDSMGMTFHKESEFRQPTISESFAFIKEGVEKKYNYMVLKNDKCLSECQLYKQVVWAPTEYVGCVMVKCEAAKMLTSGNAYPSFRMLCEYQPPYQATGTPQPPPPYISAQGIVNPGDHCEQTFGKLPDPETGLCAFTALTELENNEILHEHNRIRASTSAVAMNALKLNPHLEMRAERFGSQCLKRAKPLTLEYRTADTYYDKASVGITVSVSGVSRPTVKHMLAYVTGGQKTYTDDIEKLKKCPKDDDVCLSYWQAVWSSTTDIGCAMIKCPLSNISLSTGAGGYFSDIDTKPSIRMVCEYHSTFTEFDANGQPYDKATYFKLPGADCENLYQRKPEQFGGDRSHILCVEKNSRSSGAEDTRN